MRKLEGMSKCGTERKAVALFRLSEFSLVRWGRGFGWDGGKRVGALYNGGDGGLNVMDNCNCRGSLKRYCYAMLDKPLGNDACCRIVRLADIR